MTTGQKGAIAELAIARQAIELGVPVYRPMAEGGRYDLILDLGQMLVRVQCKWAARKGGVVVVRCRRCRRTATGLLERTYSPDEIDAVGAYCAELDRCFLIPAAQIGGHFAVQLRLEPARNNQSVGVTWADDFEFAATIRRLGAVAQLGERQRGTLEATGSSPVGSTL